MIARREFLAAAGLGGLAACSGDSGLPVVGVVPKGTNHVFWQSVHAGAIKAGEEFDLEILWNAPQLEIDSARQIAIVENLITREVDGIVLAPVDADALVSVVHRAADRGIPVAIFDSAINTDRIITFVVTDNYQGGVMAAERMGEILDGKGKVGVIGFMPGSASTMKREAGFTDTIKKFPDIENLGVKFNMADRAKALAEAENLLTAHPDLAGFFANNESSLDGTVQAVKQRGLGGKVKIVGFDASETLVADMRAGVIDSIVVQDPFKMGYESTRQMALHLGGGETVRHIDSGAYLLLPENVDTPEMQAVVFPDIAYWAGARAGRALTCRAMTSSSCARRSSWPRVQSAPVRFPSARSSSTPGESWAVAPTARSRTTIPRRTPRSSRCVRQRSSWVTSACGRRPHTPRWSRAPCAPERWSPPVSGGWSSARATCASEP